MSKHKKKHADPPIAFEVVGGVGTKAPPKKKQTRKAISVRETTALRLQAYADAQGRSISGLIEEWVAQDLERPR